ncbi:MAG TPA: ECF-type sigma factor [Gemmataceae bacterium]|jgi:DNA-directed RNA polymerase specialized sigma24 family protein|nr:ECF-type sigma factor [Gemmataceae bacterium]
MSSPGSVSHWLTQLQAGDADAAQPLWERYGLRLAGLARKKLHAARRGAADEEDVALSAFDSFCRAAQRGRFPQLRDRDNLWRLLVVITARKAIKLLKHENRQRRGGGAVLGESALDEQRPSGSEEAGIDQVVGHEPTPQFAAQVAEECGRLLDRLADDTLRSVALWKMEGYTTEEIAAKLDCAPRTVERKLRLIRGVWEGSVP